MKKLFLILMYYATSSLAMAETLVQFEDKHTGKIGVKTQSGDIIVPAQYVGTFNPEKVIRSPVIELMVSKKYVCHEKHNAAFASGDVFDRTGKYLYSPMVFDMGMDDWHEGKRRFVENCQVGFVDEAHQKIIPAQYGFAQPFFYGYSEVVVGQVEAVPTGDEGKWVLALADERAHYAVINARGEQVSGSLKPQADTDIKIHGKYYPMQYVIADEKERQLIKSLQDFKALHDVILGSDADQMREHLRFHITQRPRADFPYYTLVGLTHHQYQPEKKITLYADELGHFFVAKRWYFASDTMFQTLQSWVWNEWRDADKPVLEPLQRWLENQ